MLLSRGRLNHNLEKIKKNFTKLKTFKTHFLKFLSFVNLPCGHVMSYKKFGPIGSAVLTFIGYKQTNRQADK